MAVAEQEITDQYAIYNGDCIAVMRAVPKASVPLSLYSPPFGGLYTDSSRCSVASADYLLVFRNKGTNPVPIQHPNGLLNYAGSRRIPAELLQYRGWTGNQIENKYSHWIWRQYASAFWDDIRLERVLP